MKQIIILILMIASLNVKGQTITLNDTSFYNFQKTGVVLSMPGYYDYDTKRYTDTVLASVAYMVNDSSIRIISTRVSQLEYAQSDQWNESYWIEREVNYIDLDEKRIIKVISVEFPEHIHFPRAY